MEYKSSIEDADEDLSADSSGTPSDSEPDDDDVASGAAASEDHEADAAVSSTTGTLETKLQGEEKQKGETEHKSGESKRNSSKKESLYPWVGVGRRVKVEVAAMPSTPLHGKVKTGTKIVGTIRFVGKTHFSSDSSFTWVGVELDEPVGTHDGEVDGHRYFSCAPKHGLFVLESATAPATKSKTKSKTKQGKSKVKINTASSSSSMPGDDGAKVPSTKSKAKTPKKKKKKTKKEEPTFKLNSEVQVMIKKLSRNVPGVVKFVGRTNFHKSTMVGVELAEPAGKTNGTVDGVSYFFCRKRFGIFLPVTSKLIAKVVKKSEKAKLQRSASSNLKDLSSSKSASKPAIRRKSSAPLRRRKSRRMLDADSGGSATARYVVLCVCFIGPTYSYIDIADPVAS